MPHPSKCGRGGGGCGRGMVGVGWWWVCQRGGLHAVLSNACMSKDNIVVCRMRMIHHLEFLCYPLSEAKHWKIHKRGKLDILP